LCFVPNIKQISGIIKLKGEARGRDLCKIQYFLKYLHDRIRLYETKVAYMHFKLERAKDSLDVCWENFAASAEQTERRAQDRVKLEENAKCKDHMLDVSAKTDVQNKTLWMNKVNFIGSRQVTPEMGHMSVLARRYRKSRTAKDGEMLLASPLPSGLVGTEPSLGLGRSGTVAGIFSPEGSDISSEPSIAKAGVKQKGPKNHALIRRLSRPATRDSLKPRMPQNVFNQLIKHDPKKEKKKALKAQKIAEEVLEVFKKIIPTSKTVSYSVWGCSSNGRAPA
jgi:hypothetical protein